MLVLISTIKNYHDVTVEGDFFAVPLDDGMIKRIAELYAAAETLRTYEIEDFCLGTMHTISEEDFEELFDYHLEDGTEWIGLDAPDDIEIPQQDRLDCETLCVHNDGTFHFQCYLKHGGDDTTLRTETIPFKALGVPKPPENDPKGSIPKHITLNDYGHEAGEGANFPLLVLEDALQTTVPIPAGIDVTPATLKDAAALQAWVKNWRELRDDS